MVLLVTDMFVILEVISLFPSQVNDVQPITIDLLIYFEIPFFGMRAAAVLVLKYCVTLLAIWKAPLYSKLQLC